MYTWFTAAFCPSLTCLLTSTRLSGPSIPVPWHVQLLVFLAHHASSGSSDGGGGSRSLLERRVVGKADAQACTKQQQQIRERWRICPYILRANSAGGFNASVPPQNALITSQGHGGGGNGGGRGNGRPANGTEAMYSSVPSWLAGSSMVQTAQLLLEIAASTLPLVVSAAKDVAAASNEVEVTADGGGSASSRKHVKVNVRSRRPCLLEATLWHYVDTSRH